MFGKGIKLFKIIGFEVRIDASWLLLAILIIVTLSSGYFPFHYEDLSKGEYAVMGIIGAIGLFASLILHELSHSLMARRFGIPMEGITLFMFGGVAQMDEEPKTAKSEFLMAIAGPIASFVLAGAFYAVYTGIREHVPVTVGGVLGYLAWINMILAFFNLLPAFPLDGGRILRSALWAWRNNLRWATRIASDIGSGFGIVLIMLGILTLLGGHLIGGLWWCLIGMFLRGISHGSYRQVVIQQTLAGESVRRIMRRDPITVPPDLSVANLVNDYIYEHHFKMFPVTEGDKLLGSVSTRDIKQLSRDQWGTQSVADILREVSDENRVAPDTEAVEALSKMHKTGNSRLLVVENDRLAGIIALKDMLKFLALKQEVEGESADTAMIQRELGE